MLGIDNQYWGKLSTMIKDSKSILLSTHVNADGDGLGSEIAFYYYLKDMNKDCRIINSTPCPYIYDVIDPDSLVEKYDIQMESWLEKVDLAIIFDIGDHKRVGELGAHIYGNCKVVSIDHHPVKENHPYTLNLVDSNAPATGYMIWKYFQYIDYKTNELPISIANALYASIVTDTGSFKYQSTTPDTHYMAADLIKCGVNSYEIQKNIYEQRTFSQVKLMAEVINSLQYSKNGKIAWIAITQEMIIRVNGTDEDVDGFTEFIRGIKGVEISFMIHEKPDSSHRISFRSSGQYAINDIAKAFNGGGHKFAAGASIKDSSIKEITSNIMKELAVKLPGEM